MTVPLHQLLLVDDDDAFRRMLSLRLSREGFAVLEAGQGKQVMEALRLSPIDLVLLDLSLPDVHGLDLLRAIRLNNTLNQLPVIVLTGNSNSEVVVKALECGANDYVKKPLDFPVLFARIRTHLSLKHAQAGLQKSHDELEMRIRARTAELTKAKEALEANLVECKRTEEALIASEAKNRAILHAIPDLFFILSRDGVVLGQEGDTSRFAIFPGQFLNRSLYDLLPQPLAAQLMENLKRAFETGTIQTYDYQMESGDRLIYEESRLLAIGPEEALMICRDVTDRRTTEENLRVTEAKLLQAQKMESIGRLAGGIAHDFNNLLTAINGYADFVRMNLASNHPIYSSITQIKKAGERAASLTQQLLAFSRKQVLQPRVLDLNSLLSSNLKLLRRLISEDIELVTRFDSNLEKIKADPTQIEQVVMNLAVNARDAMPKGGRLLLETVNTLGLRVRGWKYRPESPDRFILLVISDSGYGMDAGTMSHIFEPFFTTKEQGKGTGLGLSTVYGIIEQSGGHIEVSSRVGQGTEFFIYLPKAAEEDQVLDVNLVSDNVARGMETILVVEDDPAVQDLVCQFLSHQGYRILRAQDSEDALKICQEHRGPIHLMLTDVVMPRMGGRDLANQCTRLRPSLRVLFMSGYTGDAIAQHGVLEPGLHLIQKPFSPSSLACRIREILDASPPASEVSGGSPLPPNMPLSGEQYPLR